MRLWGKFCRADVAQCPSFHKYQPRNVCQALAPERWSNWKITRDLKK